MTLGEIQQQIERINALKDDNEAAHGEEDDLRNAFICYIAESDIVPPTIRKKARLVLSSNDIEFTRWYA